MYEKIGGKPKKFALPSMYNYLFSLQNELISSDYETYKNDRLKHYSDLKLRIIEINDEDKQFLYEQHFFAYKLMNNINFISKLDPKEQIPFIQLVTMAFYYSSYSFANIFLYSIDKSNLFTHAQTYKKYNTYCHQLSYPFNLVGKFKTHRFKDFELNDPRFNISTFDYDSNALKYSQMSGFCYKSAIYSYLRGTNEWYWKNRTVKEAEKELRKKHLINFMTNDGKQIKRQHFEKHPESNYLSCLYRLRGKVNYRDSLFSLYNIRPDAEFKYYQKAMSLPKIMLNILKYYSIDIGCYLKVKLDTSKFYTNMLDDIISKTNHFNLDYPTFQKRILE